ncbi:Histidine biosynthesis trifunctional protein [Neolecta irregularis DAH-3]|uniref:Histidine biosynthesis trifunctional protein n=1 Tax=Neolecta irregularis (strain DAH-3) TaxID=1198029 RepID=A0A1U7LSH6_NEOID|nr:Histidine biosynthesis trifunctional protein [Neolecta irregularis DAH-3]|eukprot:OLL25533.1 Histidine biosynthesis trifunctional protein [Neolecta irregularis DAH-3]
MTRSIPLLPLVAIDTSEEKSLARQEFGYLGHVLVKASIQNIDQVRKWTWYHARSVDVIVDVTTIDHEQIRAVLDSAAAKCIVAKEQLELLADIHPKRLVLSTTLAVAASDELDHLKGQIGGIYVEPCVDSAFDPSQLATASQKVSHYSSPWGGMYHFFLAIPGSSVPVKLAETIKHLSALKIVPVVASHHLTTSPADEPNCYSIAAAYLVNLKTDRPDGLFTTVVADEAGHALGVVYSSEQSIAESIRLGKGVYHSRKRGLWHKGASSGDEQELLRIDTDCDGDCLRFTVRQVGHGFCHLKTATCFGQLRGLAHLEKVLKSRLESAPPHSYTARLFSDQDLLRAKILEEAEELCDAKTKDEVIWETADLIYFALTKCISRGVSLVDVERQLDVMSLKVTRRPGNAKPKQPESKSETEPKSDELQQAGTCYGSQNNSRIKMLHYESKDLSPREIQCLLRRPVQNTDKIMSIVKPIVDAVKSDGDAALVEFTAKFDKVHLKCPVLNAPFHENLMQLPKETSEAIDLAFNNVKKFHTAQLELKPMVVNILPGVTCSRFARPIDRVGLYVPGGTAVLPSTAIHLGVPAFVAGCETIIIASPPRQDGTVSPEIVYVAHKIGAKAILLAGGAQAIAALTYGTETVPKIDKIFGPGNQFVTAAKMLVQNDNSALVSIDMPAGPSEVLVIADSSAKPKFIASDLLSQAEHGPDSQVVLVAVGLSASQLEEIEIEIHKQANRLPRLDIVRKSIAHSFTYSVDTVEEAIDFSNSYAPEHLILQVDNAQNLVKKVKNAGSVFVGNWSPESCGDYASGTNHTLPTYGFARVYSGVNTASFMKHITSQQLTKNGLKEIGQAVMTSPDTPETSPDFAKKMSSSGSQRYAQELPPESGYPAVQYKRNLPSWGPRPGILFLGMLAICGIGFWRYGQGQNERRELAREKQWSRLHLLPLLQAEADRRKAKWIYNVKLKEELLAPEARRIKVYNTDRYATPKAFPFSPEWDFEMDPSLLNPIKNG